MSKLRLLGNALLRSRPTASIPASIPILSTRFLSTDGGEPKQEPSIDPFLQPPEEGLVYGRLNGSIKNTLKTDIMRFFEGCNLSADDIKVEYNRVYTPVGMLLQFMSQSSYEMALRQLIRKGRLYRLEMIDRSVWDLAEAFNGKAVLLQGLPRNAILDDVERFLSGCNYDPTTYKTFLRPGTPDMVRISLVKFPTQLDAMNAFMMKNRGFCLNNPVTMRVLQ